MSNELRKNLGRNMRIAKINEQIDKQIDALKAGYPYNSNVQQQIDALQRQKALNRQQMRQPMTEAEYAEYDDNGQYIGKTLQHEQNLNEAGQMLTDSVGHLGQGVSLGWSDELMGVIGGVGQVAANAIWRATGHSTNGENLADAWRNGYREYRDFARRELNDGYERNPTISSASEIVGNVISPVKIHKPSGYMGNLGHIISTSEDIAKSRFINSIGNGVINGFGTSNQNTLEDYGKNIMIGMSTNYVGTRLGNGVFAKGNDMYKFGRGVMNGAAQLIPHGYRYWQKEKDNE